MSSAIPTMPLIGVRSSWLMLIVEEDGKLRVGHLEFGFD